MRKYDSLDSGVKYWSENRIKNSLDYQFPVYQFAKKLIYENKFQNVVDVGCGTGLKLQYLKKAFPNLTISGIDQYDAIEYCRRNNDFGTWLVDNFENPTFHFPRPRPDLVICSDVIEHLLDPDQILRYLSALASPNGQILLSTPDRASLYRTEVMTPINAEHVREWSFDEFGEYLGSRGFDIIDHFNDYPLRFRLTKSYFDEIVRHLRKGRKFRYNQVCLITPSKNN